MNAVKTPVRFALWPDDEDRLPDLDDFPTLRDWLAVIPAETEIFIEVRGSIRLIPAGRLLAGPSPLDALLDTPRRSVRCS